jgi:prepilin-type N-terminal cleavage/methylation domain-containing protein
MLWKRGRTGRLGFTLAEMMVAIAVGAIILVGSFVLMRHMLIVSAENRDETMAVLQVQYVGFWISEDVVQAQEVSPIGEVGLHPLEVRWVEWDGDENLVEYWLEDMEGESYLGRLTREQWLRKNGEVEFESYGTSIVGEYLDTGLTKCFWLDEADDVLVLQVTADYDGNEASNTYEIHPRALK